MADVIILNSENGYNHIEPYTDNIENIMNDPYWQGHIIYYIDLGNRITIHYYCDDNVPILTTKRIKGFVKQFISRPENRLGWF